MPASARGAVDRGANVAAKINRRRVACVGAAAMQLNVAHRSLLHKLLSPLSNPRTDEYGGPHRSRSVLLRNSNLRRAGFSPPNMNKSGRSSARNNAAYATGNAPHRTTPVTISH